MERFCIITSLMIRIRRSVFWKTSTESIRQPVISDLLTKCGMLSDASICKIQRISIVVIDNRPGRLSGAHKEMTASLLSNMKMYQMYQTGTSKNPVFMRPGGFQRKFESPLRYEKCPVCNDSFHACRASFCIPGYVCFTSGFR